MAGRWTTATQKHDAERAFWKTSKDESPESDSIHNIINKLPQISGLAEFLERPEYQHRFSRAQRILELGAGQGWASCLLKRLYPEAHFVVTDISEAAVASLFKWEHIFSTTIDESYACLSYETQEADSSVDLVFCFASAHHFVEHGKTLTELARILKPGGCAIYFSEPVTPRVFYPYVYRKVNRIRPEVPEDFLITSQMKELAEASGLTMSLDYNPNMSGRTPKAVMVYSVLRRLNFLARMMPCAASLIFQKPGGIQPPGR